MATERAHGIADVTSQAVDKPCRRRAWHWLGMTSWQAPPSAAPKFLGGEFMQGDPASLSWVRPCPDQLADAILDVLRQLGDDAGFV
jgi:hypothetical protein